MQHAAPRSITRDIGLVLIVQVTAFVIYHIAMDLIFSIWFVRLMHLYDWLAAVNYLIFMAALYAPIAVFAWVAIRGRANKLLLAAMAAATGYSAYYWQYPLITGFQYSIGHFDRYSVFAIENVPAVAPFEMF